ncbi:heavy-metal-associated domain protein [Clostridioides difficile CD160]|nr:heavy-metal-associated domain protein [Clostridioides difficile CD160]
MRKKFDLIDLDCANCAAKMENAASKIEGVNSVNFSFMTQKMTLDAEDASFDEILQKIIKVCKKVEPDCEIVIK